MKRIGIIAGCLVIIVAAVMIWRGMSPVATAPPPVQSTNLDDVDPMVRSAIDEAIAGIEADPGNADRRMRLAMLYHSNGLVEVAGAAYEQALDMDDDQPKWWHFAALHYSEQGDLEQAIVAEQRVVELAPDYGAAYRRLGQWSLELGRLDEARDFFGQAERAQPGHPLNAFGSARVMLEQDDAEGAARTLTRALNAFPDIGYGYTLLARAYRRLGQDDAAAQAAARGAAPVTDDPWVNELNAMRTGFSGTILEAERLRGLGRNDEALSMLTKLRRTHPRNITLFNHLAQTYEAQSNYTRMRDTLEEALLFEPDHFATHLNLSVACERLGDMSAALRYAQRAVELNPSLGDAHRQLGILYSHMGEFDRAAEAFGEAVRNGRSDTMTRVQYGAALSSAERWDEAIPVLVDLTQSDPGSVDGFIFLAQAYARTNRREEARTALQRVRALRPNDDRIAVVEQILRGTP